jgi:hypothetical protein
MATSKTKKAATAKKNAQAGAMTLFPFGSAVTQVWVEMMTEGTRFATDRMRTDLETQMAFLSCTSPGDVFKVQSEFVQKAVEDYSGFAQRMSGMMSTAADGASRVVSRRYDDVPL